MREKDERLRGLRPADRQVNAFLLRQNKRKYNFKCSNSRNNNNSSININKLVYTRKIKTENREVGKIHLFLKAIMVSCMEMYKILRSKFVAFINELFKLYNNISKNRTSILKMFLKMYTFFILTFPALFIELSVVNCKNRHTFIQSNQNNLF